MTNLNKTSTLNSQHIRTEDRTLLNLKQFILLSVLSLGFYNIWALLHKGLKDKVILIEPNSSDNLGMRAT